MDHERIQAQIAELEQARAVVQRTTEAQLNYQLGKIDGRIEALREQLEQQAAPDGNEAGNGDSA